MFSAIRRALDRKLIARQMELDKKRRQEAHQKRRQLLAKSPEKEPVKNEDKKRRKSTFPPDIEMKDLSMNRSVSMPMGRLSGIAEETDAELALRQRIFALGRRTVSATSRLQSPGAIGPCLPWQNTEDKIGLPLTKEQRRSLQTTWRRMMSTSVTSGQGVIRIMERVFEIMFEQNPKIRAVYYRCAVINALSDRSVVTVRDHAKVLVAWIDSVISSIKQAGPKRCYISSPVLYGECHVGLAKYGFKANFWDIFGEVFADVIFMQPCVKAIPDATKAWITLIAILTDHMRVAFERKEVKINRYKRCPMHA